MHSLNSQPWLQVVDVECCVEGASSTADSVPTEVIGISSTTGHPELRVLVIPGNPGSALYYRPLLQQLHAALGGRADVWALSHAGHSSHTACLQHAGGKVWSLRDQVHHKVQFIRQHAGASSSGGTQGAGGGPPPLVLVGHSIGAHMALHVVRQLEEGEEGGSKRGDAASDGGDASGERQGKQTASGGASVAKVVCLMPFFRFDPSRTRQRFLSYVACRYGAVAAVARLLRLLPAWLLERTVSVAARGMHPEAVTTTASLLHPHAVRNNFYMAKCEFEDLRAPPPYPLLRALGATGRLEVVGCPRDVWMSQEQFQEMVESVPGIKAHWREELRHAFCVDAVQTAAVAQLLAESLAGLCTAAGGSSSSSSIRGSGTTDDAAGSSIDGESALPAAAAAAAGGGEGGGGGEETRAAAEAGIEEAATGRAALSGDAAEAEVKVQAPAAAGGSAAGPVAVAVVACAGSHNPTGLSS